MNDECVGGRDRRRSAYRSGAVDSEGRRTVLMIAALGGDMTLTAEDVDACVAAYREEEPLYPVEQDSVESLPKAFRTGEYGRRDVEWVVRWYFRRYLGAYPHGERRRTEDRFSDADFETVRDAVALAVEAEPNEYRDAMDALTALPGVDLPVASAFLAFARPDRFIVVGDREWRVVSEHTELEESYPDPPSYAAYDRYLRETRDLANDLDCDLRALYMTLWRRWKERFDER